MITRNTVREAFPVQPLGEVVDFLDNLRRPVKQADRVEGDYPYYGANGQQGTIDGFLFDEPLILVAEDGGHFSNPDRGIAYQVSGKTWVNNHAHVLRPKPCVDISFLTRVLENYDVTPYISGTTRAKLTKGQAAKIEIPLPPLEEQKRIAGILDQADALRRLRARALDKLNTLGQAIFHEMFGDPGQNPMNWEIKTLPEIGKLDRGVSKHRPRNDPALLGGEHPLIQTGDVSRAGDYITTYSSTYSDLGLAQSRKWGKGTVCITIAANIADTSVLGFDACFPDSVVGFDSGDESINFFVHRWFATVKGKLESIAPAVAQKNINLKILRDLPVVTPPKALIDEFFAREKALGQWRELVRRYEGQTERLFASLQHRAFRGEL